AHARGEGEQVGGEVDGGGEGGGPDGDGGEGDGDDRAEQRAEGAQIQLVACGEGDEGDGDAVHEAELLDHYRRDQAEHRRPDGEPGGDVAGEPREAHALEEAAGEEGGEEHVAEGEAGRHRVRESRDVERARCTHQAGKHEDEEHAHGAPRFAGARRSSRARSCTTTSVKIEPTSTAVTICGTVPSG